MFIAVTQDLISARAGELETDTELLWVRINIEGSKTLYIGGYYRANEYDEASIDQFNISMSRTPPNTCPHVWTASDMNMPGMDWGKKPTKVGCRFSS